jgi:hypothetical protein
MAIWDLAVVYRTDEPIDGPLAYGVQRFAVPGGQQGQTYSAFGSFEDGAADLMKDGYEPIGGARHIDPLHDSLWFRRRVPDLTLSGILHRLG